MSRQKTSFIPLGIKLVSIVSAIILVSLAGMTIISTASFSSSVEESVMANTLDRVELIAQKLETEVLGYVDRSRILGLALAGSLASFDMGDTLLRQDPSLVAAWLLSDTGREIIGSSTVRRELAAMGLDKGTLDTMINEAKLGVFPADRISLANASSLSGTALLTLSVPVEEGILLLLLKPDRFVASIGEKGQYLNFVGNARGEALAHPDADVFLAGASLASQPLVADSLETAAAFKQLKYQEEGATYLGSYRRILDGALIIYSTIPEDRAMAQVYYIQTTNFLITGIFLCVAILLAWLFSRSLSKPITRLAEGTKAIAEGNYHVDFAVKNKDEIGVLGRAFTDMAAGLAERDRIKTTFGKFVNKEIAEQALHSEMNLGGQDFNAAIFFSDIRGFTAMSEQLSPSAVVEFLNDYMTRMVACVDATHGIVDKFIGDAIMALWGVPRPVGNSVENAINGALLMRSALLDFNKNRGGPGKPLIKIGCGINYGHVVAGQIGSPQRMEYTVIGDAVNLASRIEALNKPFRTDILISEACRAEVGEIFDLVPMQKFMVKGKTAPQQIYAVLGRRDDAARPENLQELRRLLGLPLEDGESVDVQAEEVKYAILD